MDINNIEDPFSAIQIPDCSFLLKTDTSKLGWGAKERKHWWTIFTR